MANFVSNVEVTPIAGIDASVVNLELKGLAAFEPVGSWQPSSVVQASADFDLAVEMEFVGTGAGGWMGGFEFQIQYFLESIGTADEHGPDAGLTVGPILTVAGTRLYGAGNPPAQATRVTVGGGTLTANTIYRVGAVVNVVRAWDEATNIFTGYIEGLILQAR